MQDKEETEAAAKALVDGGLGEWSVSPMSDVLVEIVEADHPFVTRSYPVYESPAKTTPEGYDSPWIGRGHIVLLGRSCLRFGLDAGSLRAHIDFLQGVLNQIEELNKGTKKLDKDHRRILSQRDILPKEFRRYSDEDDENEIRGTLPPFRPQTIPGIENRGVENGNS